MWKKLVNNSVSQVLGNISEVFIEHVILHCKTCPLQRSYTLSQQSNAALSEYRGHYQLLQNITNL